MKVYTLRRSRNGSPRGSAYIYKVIDDAGNVVAQDEANNKFVAFILYEYTLSGGRKAVGIQSRASKPEGLGKAITKAGRREVWGIALIETDESGRPVTYTATNYYPDGDSLLNWTGLDPAFFVAKEIHEAQNRGD